jgi:IstB-like ATP binding protein
VAQRCGELARYPRLVVDEVGYIPFEHEAANLFFQLVSSRYERPTAFRLRPTPGNQPVGFIFNRRQGRIFSRR